LFETVIYLKYSGLIDGCSAPVHTAEKGYNLEL
jgi:hypothetical protein